MQTIKKTKDNISVLKGIVTSRQYLQTRNLVEETQKIHVNLGDRSYNIILGVNNLQDIGNTIGSLNITDSVIIITSPRIGDLYLKSLIGALKKAQFKSIAVEKVKDGEENKSFDNYNKLLHKVNNFEEKMTNKRLLIINLGGGVVGDIGGFVAATFKRGINYIQIPTTLLAFVDCGIGGKVGVNFCNVKNLIGSSTNPN